MPNLADKDLSELDCRELTMLLAKETNSSVIDIRFTSDCRWATFVPFGNTMWLVSGSVRDTPEESLRYCIEKWRTRSPEHPFMPGDEPVDYDNKVILAALHEVNVAISERLLGDSGVHLRRVYKEHAGPVFDEIRKIRDSIREWRTRQLGHGRGKSSLC